MRSITPVRRAAPNIRASCATPETVTPTLAAMPASGKTQPTPRNSIITTLSSTGAKAAAANLRWALSVPDCSVTSTMQKR